MHWFTLNYFDFMWRFLLGMAVFCRYNVRKNKFLLRSVCCTFALLIISVFIPQPEIYGLTRIAYGLGLHVAEFFLVIVACCICFQTSLRHLLLNGFASIIVLNCCNYFFGLFSFAGIKSDVLDIIARITLIVIYIVIYFVRRYLRIKNKTLLKNNKIPVVFVSVFLIIALCGTGINIGFGGFDQDLGVKIFINCAYTVFEILCLCLVTIFIREEKLLDENTVLNEFLENERKQYKLIKEDILSINIKCHDLKHIVKKLRENSASDDPILNEIEESVNVYDAIIRTGNDAMDVVLTEHSLYCAKNSITVSCIADGQSLNFMSSTDIYILFGNIMENAIEAVSKIVDKDKRNITLSVRHDTGVVRIREKNYRSAGELKLVDGLPVTTKNDSLNHGFGTKSIKMITEKYFGIVKVNLTEEFFTLNIVIPYPEDKKE